MVFKHVGLSWIIQSKQNLNFDFQHNCTSWILNIPWYNTTICSRWHGLLFGDYVKTARHDQYNLMCSIEADEREKKYINDESSSGVGIPLPINSTKNSLISFVVTINFIDSWIKSFKTNYLHQTKIYCEEMHEKFKTPPVILPELDYKKRKDKCC